MEAVIGTEPMRLRVQQDENNSLWYVYVGWSKISIPFNQKGSAEIYAEGFEAGWTRCRTAAIGMTASIAGVVK